MQQHKAHLPPDCKLDQLGIPYLDLVLEEVFLVPAGKTLAGLVTLADLAQFCGREVARVASQVQGIQALSQGITISASELAAALRSSPRLVLLDLRQANEFAGGSIAGARRLAELDLPVFLADCRERKDGLVTLCQDGSRAFSAAMYLRSHGFAAVRSLSGGLAAWAQAQGVLSRPSL